MRPDHEAVPSFIHPSANSYDRSAAVPKHSLLCRSNHGPFDGFNKSTAGKRRGNYRLTIPTAMTPKSSAGCCSFLRGLVSSFSHPSRFCMRPVSMSFDAQGRMWVLCIPRYPQILPGQDAD